MDTSQALTADWTIWDWDDELISYGEELTDSIDTILLGRKMTDGSLFTNFQGTSLDKQPKEQV